MNDVRRPALRPLRWWDIDAVMAIEADLFGDESWSVAMFWSELAEHDSRYYLVAEDDGDVVGYAGLCAYPGESFVQTLAVRRGRQGRGIGSALLTALIEEASRRSMPTLGLEVRADNRAAQRLYERLGFERVGVRKGYYQPSDTDAVLMLLRLPAPLAPAAHAAGRTSGG